jgi:very-short-patch-repair endonuclease
VSATQAERSRRHREVEQAAARQGHVLGYRQLYALGCTRWEVEADLRAGRWRRRGQQCIQVGDPDGTTEWWRALIEVGPAAVLDGVSSLLWAGLRMISEDRIHVALPQGAWYRQCRGVQVHETRRLRQEDVVREGIPRTNPATASVHAALWARTHREAALLIVAPVQQRLVTVPDLAGAIALIKRDKRRGLLRGLLADVSEGVHSLGEGDFARACRRRGFPRPTRQVSRQTPSGRYVYDVVWDTYDLEVEIDGAQHLDVTAAARDTLKQNAALLDGRIVLRVPNFAFRADPEPFLDQIEAVLRARGWNPPQRQRK